MTDPFGITAGAVGIAAAFTACVDCFEYIQFGRHFGRDFQTDQLALDCARLRLTRWGKAINIYDDPQLGRPDASASEVKTAKDILQQILVLFANTEQMSKKYKLNAKADEDLSIFSTVDMDPTVIAVSNRMKELAIKRQKRTSLLRTAKWALYDRYEFKELLTNLTLLIDSSETLFPAPQTQLTLVRQEAIEIRDKQALELVENAAKGVDRLLWEVAKEARTGHQYFKIMVKGKAQTGDAFSSDWVGKAAGSSHTYDHIDVDRGGTALIGNKYGGKDFWDD